MTKFFWKWLLVVSLLMIFLGLYFAFTNAGLMVLRMMGLFSFSALPMERWILAVLGSTMAGFGVSIAFLVYYPFRRQEPWAWTAIFTALMVWFIPDTLLSIFFRVISNAVFNGVILLAFAIPLLLTRREFFGTKH